MDTLYALYSQSPKCQRELAECAKELDVQLSRIKRVLDVRWVASSCRTVTAVWRSYKALYEHFSRKAADASLGSRERSKFQGLAKKLESPVFIKNLGMMHDALEELSDLYMSLQKADTSLPAASKLISKQIDVFSARQHYSSQYFFEATDAVAPGCFRGITLGPDNVKQPEIPRGQFYQALADAMTAKMLSESDLAMTRAVEALHVSSLPDDISPEHGEYDVRFLCEKFGFSLEM